MTDTPSPAPATQTHSAADGHDLALVFVALMAMVLLPVFLVQVAPLADWINHLGRMAVMAKGSADPWLSTFYEIKWALIPNLAMDVVVPPLARLVGVYAAGQIFMAMIVTLIVTGPFAVQYAVYHRTDPFPLVVFLFVYNDIFLVGLANYLFGIGLCLWGLALWILLRERNLALRILVSLAFVAALYVSHLYTVGLYGIAIGAYELHTWLKRGWPFDRRLLREIVAMAVPFAPVVPVLHMSATWGLAGDYQWNLHGKADGILMAFSSYSDVMDVAIAGGVALVLSLIWRRGLIRFHTVGGVFLILAGAVFMAMPAVLFGSYMADQRMPIAIVLIIVGFGRLEISTRSLRTGFLALVIGLSALRIGDVAVNWVRLSRVYDDFRRAFTTVAPGSKILITHADDPEGWDDFRDAISHAACLAMIDRSALVSTAFTVTGKQIMAVRPQFHDRVDTEDGDPPTISRVLASTLPGIGDKGNFWDGWRDKHDYLIVLYTLKGAGNPNPNLLTLAHDGIGYQLYRIKPPAPAAG